MKKMSVFALLGLLVLGMAATASAADIKATGSWKVEAYNVSGTDFIKKDGDGATEQKSFNIEQRMRTAFQFIANENLKAVLDTQIGTSNWGNGLYALGSGRSTGANQNAAVAAGTGSGASNAVGNIMLRKGYLDFKWPGTSTNFLVGYTTVALPSAVGGGSAILDDQMAAAVMVTPITDNVKLLAGYARLLDSNTSQTGTAGTLTGSTYADAVFAAVPIDFKGFNITPFAAYAYAGADAAADATGAPALTGFAGKNSSNNEGVRAYWGGFATTITALDGFKIMADFNYGKASWNNQGVTGNKSQGGRQGWLFDIAVDYTGLSMMTPSVFFAYSSGEKGNSTESTGASGRMPVVGNPQNWALGSFFFGDRNFATNPIATAGGSRNTMGFWAAGLSLKDIKLIDKLSHTAHIMYVKGTNDENFLNENVVQGGVRANGAIYGGFLTKKDSLWEFDLNTKYMIYDELSVFLDLGYINANFDKDAWGASSLINAATLRNAGSQDAYRIALGLNYNF